MTFKNIFVAIIPFEAAEATYVTTASARVAAVKGIWTGNFILTALF
jgi:hypothetical protein